MGDYLTLEELDVIHELNFAVTQAVETLGVDETAEKINLLFNKNSNDYWKLESVKETDADGEENYWGVNYGNEVTK